jgi:hypothetical protein
VEKGKMSSSVQAQPVAFMKGYVTTYAAIAGKSASELEQSLGFHPGALTSGYLVYALSSPVAVGEFEWKDRTKYSDGWHYDLSINEYVQRRDELRAHLGKSNNWDEVATDLQLARFMEEQRRRINVRAGSERIVKVKPKGTVANFPDSPFRSIPQWRLNVIKTFRLVP